MMSYNRRKYVEFIGEGTYLISWQTTWTKQSAGRLSACIWPVLKPIHSFVSIYWHRMYRPSITLELWKLWLSILRLNYVNFTCDLHEHLQANTCMSAMRICHWPSVALTTEFGRNPYFQDLSLYLNIEDYHKHYRAIHVIVPATQILKCSAI